MNISVRVLGIAFGVALAAGCVAAPPKQTAATRCAHVADREAHASCVRLNSAFDEMREEREAERNTEALRNAGESLQALGDEMLSRPRTTLSRPPSLLPEIGPTGLDDLYAVKHGDIRLHSPDGPVVGETTRIGGDPPPTVVLVP
jgi:hypothetical protein